MYKMYKEVKKIQPELISNKELKIVIDDIRHFLIGVKVEYQTNQHLIGIKYLFRDFLVKA